MTTQMASLGRPWAYFDAKPGQAPTALPYNAARARWCFGRTLAEAEIGCFESHRQLWLTLAENPANCAMLILEDDVVLDLTFFKKIDGVLQAMATKGVDFLRLYAITAGPAYPDGQLDGHRVIRYAYAAWGTQAYILTQAGAERLIMRINRIDRPVDNELDRWWRHGLANRAIHPFPVRTADGPSAIAAPRANTILPPHYWAVLLNLRNTALKKFFSFCTVADLACRKFATQETEPVKRRE